MVPHTYLLCSHPPTPPPPTHTHTQHFSPSQVWKIGDDVAGYVRTVKLVQLEREREQSSGPPWSVSGTDTTTHQHCITEGSTKILPYMGCIKQIAYSEAIVDLSISYRTATKELQNFSFEIEVSQLKLRTSKVIL